MRDIHARNGYRPSELNLIPIISIFVVLIPVLLSSVEFSRVSIVQFDPSNDRGVQTESQVKEPPAEGESQVRICAVVTPSNATLFVNDIAFPTVTSDKELVALLGTVRDRFPGNSVNSALIASESDVIYDRIIRIMDILREKKFTDISVTRVRA